MCVCSGVPMVDEASNPVWGWGRERVGGGGVGIGEGEWREVGEGGSGKWGKGGGSDSGIGGGSSISTTWCGIVWCGYELVFEVMNF